MAWLTQRDIPPTPENFEIAYSLACNANTELKQTVNAMVADGTKLDADALSNIHHRFFRAPKNEAVMEELGEKLAGQLDFGAANVGKRPDAITPPMAKPCPRPPANWERESWARPASRNLIDQVVGATRAMEARSKTLESQLRSRRVKVTELRDRLESVRKESLTDPLTGIANRKAFDTELQESIERAIETANRCRW
jgi:diguanylate cyclase